MYWKFDIFRFFQSSVSRDFLKTVLGFRLFSDRSIGTYAIERGKKALAGYIMLQYAAQRKHGDNYLAAISKLCMEAIAFFSSTRKIQEELMAITEEQF
jgi:hypothetical protein